MNGACPLFTPSREDGDMREEPEDEECGEVGRCDPHDELANNHQSAINRKSSIIINHHPCHPCHPWIYNYLFIAGDCCPLTSSACGPPCHPHFLCEDNQ